MLSYSFLLLAVAISGVVSEEFGMRLTTEKSKKEDKQYQFRYFVKDDKTGDYKIQEETKEGDSVKGSYTIAEPNGDLRTVTYKAGPGRGFEAKVDVKPSASPMKTTEVVTMTNETASTKQMESSVKNFPGGFTMNISSMPHSETKTEMGVTFSMKPNASTEEVTESSFLSANTTEVFETTEPLNPVQTKLQKTEKPTTSTPQTFEAENTTFQGESRDIGEDLIEKEIEEAMHPMPDPPELVLADNKTFKFYKDPEEALLDERINQIARQLAETSLRREYEERKLGHFLPISLRPINTGYLSKSMKFMNDVSKIKPTETTPVKVVTQVKIVPQYIYKDLIPTHSPVVHRLPAYIKPETTAVPTSQTVEKVTETTRDKSINQLKEINRILRIGTASYGTVNPERVSVMPVHVPTFLQFISPIQRFIMETQRTFVPNNQPKLYISPLNEDLTTGTIPMNDDSTFYAHVSTVNDQSTEKS